MKRITLKSKLTAEVISQMASYQPKPDLAYMYQGFAQVHADLDAKIAALKDLEARIASLIGK